jgi:hypothetical protein
VTHYAAPSPYNYTLGCHGLFIAGVDVGNIVTASVSADASFEEMYSAVFGRAVTNYDALTDLQLSIEVEIDEPNRTNLNRFLLANQGSGAPGSEGAPAVAVTFTGIAEVGNAFSWAIPKARVLPNGSFGWSTESWTTARLLIIPEWDTTATHGYGQFVHLGALP